MDNLCAVVGKLTGAFINPALALVFAIGLLVFVYGLVEFVWGLSHEAGKKEEGKQHMLWGMVGMFIMAAAIAIIKIIGGIVGATLPCGF
jgi:hypothetical protein